MPMPPLWCATVLVLACTGHAVAQPKLAPVPAPTTTPQVRPPDGLFEAAKADFETLPELERKAIQDALIWTGDYNGTVTGEFGRRTFEAIIAYAGRAKLPSNGILDPLARKKLLAIAQRAQDAAKFSVAIDPKTGVRLGVPERVLIKRDVNPNGGSRWQSADGKITLDTRAIPPSEGDLASIYERQLAMPGRQVTYKLLRADFFVVSGETPAGKFYTRYAIGPGGLRGFSVGYDKALATDFDRMVLAIANSFVPFPGLIAGAAAAAPLQARPPAPPERPRPPSLVASGVLVGSGYVVTSAAIDNCPEPRVSGSAASVVKIDMTAGLALLRWPAGVSSPSLAFSPTQSGGSVIVLSYTAGPDDQVALVATPAQSFSDQILAPLQPGASGGAVLTREGALIAIVSSSTQGPSGMAGLAPPRYHPIVSAETITRFVFDHVGPISNVALTEDRRTASEIATTTARSLVPVGCRG